MRDDSSFSSEQLPVLYDENHNFEGWYIGDRKILENYNITSDIILTAKWTPKCKSVQYYVDNKQIERKELFYYSETPEKEVLDYSSANKAFLGWKKDVNSSMVDFPIGSTISYDDIPSSDGQLKLYAYFIEIDTSITVDIAKAAGIINKIQKSDYFTKVTTFTVYIIGSYTDFDIKKISDVLKEDITKRNDIILDFSALQGMTVVNDHEFDHSKYVKIIKLPEGLTTVGEYAFSSIIDKNNQAANIELSDSINMIKPFAFKRVNVDKFPESLTCVGPYAFAESNSLPHKNDAARSLDIPNTVRRIEEHAFRDSRDVVRAIIPSSVRFISIEAFSSQYSNPPVRSVALPGMGTSEWGREFCKWYTANSIFDDIDSNYIYYSGKQLYSQYMATHTSSSMSEQQAAKYLNGTEKIGNEVAWYKKE